MAHRLRLETEAELQAMLTRPGVRGINGQKLLPPQKSKEIAPAKDLAPTDAAKLLYRQILEARLPGQWCGNHPFHESRKWEIDIVLLSRYPPLAIEVEGWGHRTRKRFLSDIEKYNAVACLGWHMLRFTPTQVRSGEALALIRAYLGEG